MKRGICRGGNITRGICRGEYDEENMSRGI